MDDLATYLQACEDEVALEGRRGCTLPKLWQLLEQRGVDVSDRNKAYLWRIIVGMATGLVVCQVR